jgi:hypothetical protein
MRVRTGDGVPRTGPPLGFLSPAREAEGFRGEDLFGARTTLRAGLRTAETPPRARRGFRTVFLATGFLTMANS